NAEISTAKLISTASSDKEKLSLVIGPYCSNAFEKVADLYANGKVIRVIPMPLTTEQENYSAKGLFKIGGNAEAEAVAFYSFYKNKFADKNLAMFYDQDLPQTVEVAEMVQKLFVKDGHENQIQMFEIGNMKDNYEKFAQKVVQKNQVVYLLGSTHEIAKAAQNLQEENEEIILFTDEYLATGYFFKEMGNFVEGVYLLSLQDLKAHPEFTEDLVQLRLSGNEPKGLGVYGYAAVNLWKEMVDRAESFDFDKVCSKGEKETYKLPWGNVQFLHGVASKSSGYQIYQIKNGEYTQVD
ncbi:MAG: ABC transporter substrate-binding protein, partial [Alphaproteobacteria bacterium]|nr:ABC transporter substrate-binding protein [Alphaproteobacteria bacterium]